MLRYIVDRLLLWAIGSLVALVILGVVVYWSVFRDHHHPRTVRDDLQRLYDGARSYHTDEVFADRGAARFVQPSTGFVPPLGECCRQGGTCKPEADLWAVEPWSSLLFSMDEPYRHSFSYQVAADGTAFTVAARGDIDCDGVYSTFEMHGVVGDDGFIPGRSGLFRDQELE